MHNPSEPLFLYSMCGWFADKRLEHCLRTSFQPDFRFDIPPGKVPFGGYFGIDKSEKFVGNLMDFYDSSSIIGILNGNSLRFEKRYDDRHSSIRYEFEKQGSFWVGRYLSYMDRGEEIDGDEAQVMITPSNIVIPSVLFSIHKSHSDNTRPIMAGLEGTS